MIQTPPGPTLTATVFPDATLCLSPRHPGGQQEIRTRSGAGGGAGTGTSYRFRAGRTQAETQMIEHDTPDTLCPVTLSQSVAGDRWNLLILREIFLGNLRFEQIQAHTGATPQILTVRLKRLEANGMVERRLYRERPPRHEYRPTAKGEAFHAVQFGRAPV